MKTRNSSLQRQLFRFVPAAIGAIAIAAGCHKANDESTSPPQTSRSEPASTAGRVEPGQVILTGCLQEGKNGIYILTVVNEPKDRDSSDPAIVAQEKLAAAEAAYRLSPDGQRFGQLLGGRVRIEGTLIKVSDLVATTANRTTMTGTTGQSDEIKSIQTGRTIKQSDLAQVNVTAIERVANSCGEHATRAPVSRPGKY